jgi:hypothetical protein
VELQPYLDALSQKLAERIARHDKRNRNGLPDREYLMNCGRIKECEEILGLMRQTIDELRKREDSDSD